MDDLSTLQARIALAQKYATKYGLDTQLVCAVIEQESGWQPWSIRYEPDFFQHYIQPMLDKTIIHDLTEARARAFSWGAMQLMGEVAREMGFTGHLASLCDPEIGVDWGCKKLKRCIDLANGEYTAALLYWNGGGNRAYAPQVIARMANYEVTQ